VFHPRPEENIGRRRLELIGLFAHDLHIRPWETGDQLTIAEFRMLADWVERNNSKDEE